MSPDPPETIFAGMVARSPRATTANFGHCGRVSYFRRFRAPEDLDFLIALALAKTFFMTRRSDADKRIETNRPPTVSLSRSIEAVPKMSNERHSGACIQHVAVFLNESAQINARIPIGLQERLLNSAWRGVSGFNLGSLH